MIRLELVGTAEGIEIYCYGNLFDRLPEIGISGDGLELTARLVNQSVKFPGDCIAECEINPPADQYPWPIDSEIREIK